MFHDTRVHLVSSITVFATAAMALWCAWGQPLAAQDTSARIDTGEPVAHIYVLSKLTTNSTDSNAPTTALKNVTDPRPPISCKVGAEGILTDCRINEGYNLNDVANWFQDDHDRTLQLAVNSVTLAKKFEHSLESCTEEKGKK
jgi:hypothetical protein